MQLSLIDVERSRGADLRDAVANLGNVTLPGERPQRPEALWSDLPFFLNLARGIGALHRQEMPIALPAKTNVQFLIGCRKMRLLERCLRIALQVSRQLGYQESPLNF